MLGCQGLQAPLTSASQRLAVEGGLEGDPPDACTCIVLLHRTHGTTCGSTPRLHIIPRASELLADRPAARHAGVGWSARCPAKDVQGDTVGVGRAGRVGCGWTAFSIMIMTLGGEPLRSSVGLWGHMNPCGVGDGATSPQSVIGGHALATCSSTPGNGQGLGGGRKDGDRGVGPNPSVPAGQVKHVFTLSLVACTSS